MDFVTAASFTVAYQTSYYALKSRAQLQRGETVLVLGGAGGCGLAAIQVSTANVQSFTSTSMRRSVMHLVLVGRCPLSK
jgi:NADPH:quinone reductase-like Zn-dependent oxidoreductase